MKVFRTIAGAALLCFGAIMLAAPGCCSSQSGACCDNCPGRCFCGLFHHDSPTPPFGKQSDEMWRRQEAGGTASEFVVYQHEFELNGSRLNMGGEDHVKAIAARVRNGVNTPIIVERSMTSEKTTEPESRYPVNPNPALDMQRRDLIVRSLVMLGVSDAEQRVVVSPALASGITSSEAARAYQRGQSSTSGGGYGGYGTTGFFGGGAY